MHLERYQISKLLLELFGERGMDLMIHELEIGVKQAQCASSFAKIEDKDVGISCNFLLGCGGGDFFFDGLYIFEATHLGYLSQSFFLILREENWHFYDANEICRSSALGILLQILLGLSFYLCEESRAINLGLLASINLVRLTEM